MDLSFLKWIEHAGFLLDIKGKNVYIDPFRIRGAMPKADVVFISHTHQDHLNEEALAKISTANTQFVAPKETAGKLAGKKVLVVEPGKDYEVQGISFSTVAAYNVNKFRAPDVPFHPKTNGWVGYIVDANGTKVYHAGDTDATDEMTSFEADLALLPSGGTYTMTLDEAIRATETISAKEFAPMHYKALLGKDGYRKSEDAFKARVKNGIILEQIQEPYYSF